MEERWTQFRCPPKRAATTASAAPGPASAERYVLDGDARIVFGDERLARLHEGDRVSASVYELCCGPPLVTFPVTVLELASDEVGLGVFADVSATGQLNTNYEHAEATQRLLALQT